MARYFTKQNRNWTAVDVRGTSMDKMVLWNDGFDIQASLFRMTEGMVINRHTHQHWVQVVVLEGEMQVESEKDGAVRIPEGGCYLLEPGDTHSETAIRESVVLVTQLDDHPAYLSRSANSKASLL